MVSESLRKIVPFLVILVVYVLGMRIDVMDTDAAQYASIAREMVETGNYLHFKHRYEDYLDKPPLLFWLSAWSMKLFGVNNVAYKLPSMLFALLGIFSTYKLTRLWYDKEIAYWAALMLATCQTLFLITNDIRTDTLLMSCVVFALWQLMALEQTKKWIYLLGSGLGIGLAMLAKGPMGIMLPVLAMGTDIVLKREWRRVFNWRWVAVLALAGLLLIPMLKSQYEMYGQKAIRFFFWTQSFGRITGESDWRNDAGYFFLFHSYLWAFLPWTLLWMVAYAREIRQAFQQKSKEYVVLGGFTLVFIALSFSKYKLPHYIYVVMPLGAILTAKHTLQTLKSLKRFQNIAQTTLQSILWILAFGVMTWVFPTQNILLWAIMVIGLVLTQYLQWIKKQVLFASVCTIISLNILASGYVYPLLLKYQCTHTAAVDALKSKPKNFVLATYKVSNHSLDFYAQKIIPHFAERYLLEGDMGYTHRNYWIYTYEDGLKQLQQSPYLSCKVVKEYSFFHVANLSLPFLNPNTRSKHTHKRYLVEITLAKTGGS